MNTQCLTIYDSPTPKHAVRGAPTTAGCFPVAVQGSAFPFPASFEAYQRGIADLRSGRSKRFKNVEDLIAELKGE